MSIFKETFKSHVSRQLAIREKVIAQGNPIENTPFTQRRLNSNSITLDKLRESPVVVLEPGAFHAYSNEKQCVLRMTSFVDYVEDVGLEIGIDGNNSTFESLKGSTLSRNFILEGGVLSDFSRNIEGEQVTRRISTPRAGFRRPGLATNLSYGDGAIVSDASADGFGIVPMPGIIDAHIRTKSAYGSLREAKINFVCHNQRQLEILEMLYMRPGYPILLEWGWAPYINNEGGIERTLSLVENDLGEKIYTNNITQEEIFRSIEKLKKSHVGNYDGFLGYVKNFGFKSRPDGGFDCYTELISVGEIIDSLKIDRFNVFASKENNALKKNGAEGVLGILFDANFSLSSPEAAEEIANKTSVQVAGAGGSFDIFRWFYSRKKIEETLSEAFSKNLETSLDLLQGVLRLKNLSDLRPNYLFTFRLPNSEDNNPAYAPYIRWDALCVLLNEQFIPLDEKNNKLSRIIPDKEIIGESQIEIQTLLYAPYTSEGKLTDFSCDINVCILPHQFTYYKADTEQIPDISVWDPFYSVSPGTSQILYNGKEINLGETVILDETNANRRIGNIFINVNMLKGIIDNNKNNPNYTVGQLVKDIWTRINSVCPNHNFQLVDDKTSSGVYIIDFPVSNAELPLRRDVFEITPLSNENILREFDFESNVPNSQTSTIAIQAQDPRNVQNIDDVTYLAFNRSIKNRLSSIDTVSNAVKVVDSSNEIRKANERDLKNLWVEISDYIKSFQSLLENPELGPDEELILENITGKVKRYQSLQESINISEGKTTTTAVIPLSINATFDGISGIIIGNVFRITQDRLPKAYRRAEVGFIVFGEEQYINSEQDWVTKIDGKMILLPEEGTKEIKQPRPLDSFNYSLLDGVSESGLLFGTVDNTSTTGVVIDSNNSEIAQIQNQNRVEREADALQELGYPNQEITLLQFRAVGDTAVQDEIDNIIQNGIPYEE